MIDEKFDYIIVGAGIAGLSCAYFLIKKNKNVLLIEKRNNLCNTSTAAAGLLSPIKFHTYPPHLQNICIEALKFYPQFLNELNMKHLIQSQGELILSQNKDELIQIQQSFKRFNFNTTILNKKELLDKFPYISNEIKFGLEVFDMHSINNVLLLNKLLNVVIDSGKILFSATLYKVGIEYDRAVFAQTSVGKFHGEKFIFATGAENLPLIKDLFDVELKGIKGILLELEGKHNIKVPMVYNHYYTVPKDGCSLLAGTVVKENDLTENVYIEYIDEIITNIKHFYPDITKLSLKNIKTGLRPYIEGRNTICEMSKKISNTYILNGLFRNGILIGPYLAYNLVNSINL